MTIINHSLFPNDRHLITQQFLHSPREVFDGIVSWIRKRLINVQQSPFYLSLPLKPFPTNTQSFNILSRYNNETSFFKWFPFSSQPFAHLTLFQLITIVLLCWYLMNTYSSHYQITDNRLVSVLFQSNSAIVHFISDFISFGQKLLKKCPRGHSPLFIQFSTI